MVGSAQGPQKNTTIIEKWLKPLRKATSFFFCSRGVINHVGFALASSMSETDKTGEIWKVKIKSY